jgi:hypothetical protein
MNSRYFDVFKIKVDNFLTELKGAKSLYEDLTKKNNLIHPGEYGMYKERTLQELVKFIVPYKYQLTDGYIINSYNETSTQCDLILYDKLNTPLVEFGNRFQFIPVESVAAIGEVKSTLSKRELIEALIKLAKIKQLFKPSEEATKFGLTTNQLELFVPFTFIICDDITGINDEYTFKHLIKDIAHGYTSAGIEPAHFFNIMICLSANKAFSYRTSQEFNDPHVPEGTKISYPIRWNMMMNGSIVNCDNSYTLLREFATSISHHLNQRPHSFPDPVDYLW